MLVGGVDEQPKDLKLAIEGPACESDIRLSRQPRELHLGRLGRSSLLSRYSPRVNEAQDTARALLRAGAVPHPA